MDTTGQLGMHWQRFRVILLKENHRQEEDKPYADMLNRFRTGDQTEEDMLVLQTRVRPMNHPDTKGAMYISCTNKEVGKLNQQGLSKIESEIVVVLNC